MIIILKVWAGSPIFLETRLMCAMNITVFNFGTHSRVAAYAILVQRKFPEGYKD